MLACLATLIFATVSFIVIEMVSFRNDLIETNKTLAKVIGMNCCAPLMFNDRKAAEEAIFSLAADPNIIAGYVIDKNGELFAQFCPRGVDESLNPSDSLLNQVANFVYTPVLDKHQQAIYNFNKGHLALFHPISHDKEFLGGIYLQSNLNEFWYQLSDYAVACMAIVLISLFVAFLLSFKLRGLISSPIMNLAAIMDNVSVDKDYSVRIKTDAQDEISSLYRGFNNMLGQIQARDERLYITQYIIDHMGIAAFWLNKDARFIYVNNAVSVSLGYAKDRLLNMSLSDMDPSFSLSVWAEHWDNLRRRKTLTFESQHQTHNGDLISVEVNANYVQFKGQEYYCAFARDVSTRKQLESQLEQAKKLEAIGTLTGGVAHDLNNILGPLVGFPELLLMEIPDDSPLVKPLVEIKKSGERAAAVVQDMLTLARRGVAVQDVLNLNQVIADNINSHAHRKLLSDHPTVQFRLDLEPNLLNILGSTVHLSKCITNLVSNAMEAISHEGTVTLKTRNLYIDESVAEFKILKEGDYVLVNVSDTGAGISQEDLYRIFEPFYTKKKMGRSGTGLGMTVVRGTVEDHKGYIDIQSAEGSGTDVNIYLPVSREKMEIKNDDRSIDETKGNERILVVDDVKEQRETARKLLAYLGYSTETVSSGDAAIEFLSSHEVDLLILDMIMEPGMDGLDTYRKVLEIYPDQKAIIATGYAETERVQEALRLGACAYLKKPYLLRSIGSCVRGALDG